MRMITRSSGCTTTHAVISGVLPADGAAPDTGVLRAQVE